MCGVSQTPEFELCHLAFVYIKKIILFLFFSCLPLDTLDKYIPIKAIIIMSKNELLKNEI